MRRRIQISPSHIGYQRRASHADRFQISDFSLFSALMKRVWGVSIFHILLYIFIYIIIYKFVCSVFWAENSDEFKLKSEI